MKSCDTTWRNAPRNTWDCSCNKFWTGFWSLHILKNFTTVKISLHIQWLNPIHRLRNYSLGDRLSWAGLVSLVLWLSCIVSGSDFFQKFLYLLCSKGMSVFFHKHFLCLLSFWEVGPWAWPWAESYGNPGLSSGEWLCSGCRWPTDCFPGHVIISTVNMTRLGTAIIIG